MNAYTVVLADEYGEFYVFHTEAPSVDLVGARLFLEQGWDPVEREIVCVFRGHHYDIGPHKDADDEQERARSHDEKMDELESMIATLSPEEIERFRVWLVREKDVREFAASR